LTELGNWLLENHLPFIEEFKGSHIKKSYRLQTKRTYITNRILELLSLGLVEQKGYEKAEKSDENTPIYAFTEEGKIVAWLMEARYAENATTREVALEMFFTEICMFIANYPSSFTKCLVEVFNRLIISKQIRHLSDEYINLFIPIFQSRNSLFHFFRHILLAGFYSGDITSNSFLDVLKTMDPEDQKFVLLQLKLDIESNYYNSLETTYDWENKRYESVADPNIVIVQGYCLDCKIPVAIGMDILKFLEIGTKPKDRSLEGDLYVTARIVCTNCNKHNSRFMLPIWYIPTEVLSPNVTSFEVMEQNYEKIQSNNSTILRDGMKYVKYS
jgi:hypothetical protein